MNRLQMASGWPILVVRLPCAVQPHVSPMYVLIVEDQQENSQLLLELLTPLGFELCCAKNGKSGIALWQQWHPHLILMDLRMPVVDGVKATQTIRAIEYDQAKAQGQSSKALSSLSAMAAPALSRSPSSRTKIIALTASPFEETKANAIAIGCDDFLRKPIQADLLLEKMAEHLSLTYLYQSSAQLAKAADRLADPEILSPQALGEMLADMPPEWIQQLHELAVKGADRPILQLLAQLPKTHTPLVKTLTHWLNDFNFDKIIQLTRPKC